MRRLSLVLIIAWIGLSVPARSITFLEVPEACQVALASAFGSDASVTIDWRGWRGHLLDLGYSSGRADELISQSTTPEELKSARENVRNNLGQVAWTWSTGFNSAQIANFSRWQQNQTLPLHVLVASPGFNAPEAVREFLRHEALFDNQQRSLAQAASFWLVGPHQTALADSFLQRIDIERSLVDAHRWIARFFAERNRSIPALVFDHQSLDSLEFDEILLLTLDYFDGGRFNVNGESRITRHWLRHRLFPALRSDRVRSVSFGKRFALNCADMCFGFLRLLVDPGGSTYLGRDPAPAPLVVRLRGQVVGLVKGEGDPSMLALRSVETSRGHLSLMIGGVYRIPHVLGRPGDHGARRGRWPHVDVDELSVKPLGPVLNEEAWERQNLPLILQFMPTLKPNQFDQILREMARAGDETPLRQTRARLHRRAWPRVLERIDQLRRKLETE